MSDTSFRCMNSPTVDFHVMTRRKVAHLSLLNVRDEPRSPQSEDGDSSANGMNEKGRTVSVGSGALLGGSETREPSAESKSETLPWPTPDLSLLAATASQAPILNAILLWKTSAILVWRNR